MKEDKPKEFIAAIKLLLTNGQILDPMFALAPLKHNEAMTKPKLKARSTTSSVHPHDPRPMHQQNTLTSITNPLQSTDPQTPYRSPTHTNVSQGSQTSSPLWLLLASSELIHTHLLSYNDDTDNIQYGKSYNYHRTHIHSQ